MLRVTRRHQRTIGCRLWRCLATSSGVPATDSAPLPPPPPPSPQNAAAAAAAAIQLQRPRKRQRGAPLPPPPTPPASSFPQWEPQDCFRFEVVHRSSKSQARVGRIHTPHGSIDTPGFVPVATNAALKAVPTALADAEGAQLMFVNSYHTGLLHPGADVVAAAGGLHAFMGRARDRPLITDSGGFQVFSLAHGTVHAELHSLKRSAKGAGSGQRAGNLVLKVEEEGVTFRSYRDGTKLLLSPETAVHTQKLLGADIILPLDELPPYHIDAAALAASVERSHRWEARSLQAHLKDPRQQAMWGIVHGGSDLALRRHSADYVSSLPFDGFAVGGALGRDRQELVHIMRSVMGWVPRNRPCHVLGIADPVSVPALVTLGCDTFDSCHATRAGRHGTMLTDEGPLRVLAAANKSAHRSPVDSCGCFTCRTHSLSYLHHLLKAKEPLAATLLSLHNIHHLCDLMARLRQQILAGEV